LAVLAAACDLPGRPKRADRPVPQDQVLSFPALYRENCAGCHGADGKLGPAPPLNDPTFLAIVPDEVLLKVITEGRPNTPMPAFARDQGGALTAAQVKVLAQGIKPHWEPPRPANEHVPPYLVAESKPGKAGDTKRGGQVFARACAGCHGSQGQGGTSDQMRAGAINDPAFLALISDQAVRRYAITGRPDLGMPDFAGDDGRPPDFKPLTSSEITDLVALLASWRKGEAVAGR
jgi:mono/diheme cytochrome c family protein